MVCFLSLEITHLIPGSQEPLFHKILDNFFVDISGEKVNSVPVAPFWPEMGSAFI